MAGFGAGQNWSASRGGNGNYIVTAEAETEDAKAEGIANSIRHFESEGIALDQQCILCRTNNQADELCRKLESGGIPVLYLGALFDRPEIKDLLALLSLACEPGAKGIVRVAAMEEYAVPLREASSLIHSIIDYDGETIEALDRFAVE